MVGLRRCCRPRAHRNSEIPPGPLLQEPNSRSVSQLRNQSKYHRISIKPSVWWNLKGEDQMLTLDVSASNTHSVDLSPGPRTRAYCTPSTAIPMSSSTRTSGGDLNRKLSLDTKGFTDILIGELVRCLRWILGSGLLTLHTDRGWGHG